MIKLTSPTVRKGKFKWCELVIPEENIAHYYSSCLGFFPAITRNAKATAYVLFVLYKSMYTKVLVLELEMHVPYTCSICDYAIKFLTARFLMFNSLL